MTFDELVKPKFEIDFWLRHFKGLSYENSRAYEAYLTQPRANSMFFADTMEYFEEDFIDIIDTIEQHPIDKDSVFSEFLSSEPTISPETYSFIDETNLSDTETEESYEED